MKVLSVSEFDECCRKQVSPIYIFSNKNQHSECIPATHTVLRFTSVVTSLQPNRVCFMNQESKICFEGVKEIKMHDNDPAIGKIFEIVCACGATENSYTMLLD